MPRTPKSGLMNPTGPTDPSAASPLAEQMRRDSAASRQALDSFGLTPESYASISERASMVQQHLVERGAGHAAARLGRLVAVVQGAVEKPSDDLSTRGRAYLALLDSILMQSLAEESQSPRLLARLDAEARRLDAGEAGAMALLTVAGMCAEIGAKVSPKLDGPVPVEWQRWRFGLVAASAPDAASISARAAGAIEDLRASRMPGLVVMDLAQPACPEQRPLRVAHPQAGADELRARLDRLLADSRPELLRLCDRDHAIGVIGTAFMALHMVAAGQVAFITAYRFMPLIEAGDPRELKLAAFRRAFGDL